jgi:MFS family permease
MAEYRSLRAVQARLWRGFVNLSAGGSWSAQLPATVRHNLRSFFFDGIFSSASDGITASYLVLFILNLGASAAQIGLMTALASLSAMLLLLPGAMLAERFGKRKTVVLLSGGVVSRIGLFLMVLTPLFFKGPAAVYVVIGIKVIADGFANLGFPAWMSITADIIPLAWRGRYFGTRNTIMGITNMMTTLIAGLVITALHGPAGYQWALGLAFAIGMVSTYSYAQIKEPENTGARAVPLSYSPASIWNSIKADRNFLAYLVFSLTWNFSLNISGPFFGPYQVQVLKSSAAMIGLVGIASSLASLPAPRIFGQLSDKWGPRRVQLLAGFLIPLLPLAWVFTSQPWHGIPINIFGGFLWAGFGLVSFNYFLILTPPEHRARYSAINQIAVAIASAIGAALGGVLAGYVGYHWLFIFSGIGRFIGMGIFARFVRADSALAPASGGAAAAKD